MIQLFRSFWQMLFGHTDDTPVLDNLPIGGTISARKIVKARQQAEARHGKRFATDILKPRETPPSHDLIQIQKAVPIKREAVVTKIARGVK